MKSAGTQNFSAHAFVAPASTDSKFIDRIPDLDAGSVMLSFFIRRHDFILHAHDIVVRMASV
jgi:hypothetical protein